MFYCRFTTRIDYCVSLYQGTTAARDQIANRHEWNLSSRYVYYKQVTAGMNTI